ncbi:MAG: AraC family transcriptional regulator [Bryobacteraceae bacterium]
MPWQDRDASRFWFNESCDLGFHHFRYPRHDFEAPPHSHPEYTFLLCLGSTIEVETGRRVIVLRPGDLVVTHPAEIHRGRFGDDGEPGEGLAIVVSRRMMHRLAAGLGLQAEPDRQDIRLLRTGSSPVAGGFVQALLDEWSVQRPGRDLAVESLLIQMLVGLLRDYFEMQPVPIGARVEPELPGWQMGLALEYMNSTGKAHFGLPALCDRVGSSESRFVRLFKRSTGSPPHQVFDRILAVKALHLLRGGRAVKEVAYTLGFRSDSHFCVTFRKVMGYAPGTALSHEIRL